MSSFTINKRKTPFKKYRDEEEAKKKRDDDETARLYAEFIESFQSEDAPGSKPFVRGGMINPNDKPEGGNSKDGVSGSKKGSRYVPSFVPHLTAAAKAKEAVREEPKDKPKEKERGKTRNIDNIMEELKREQELREKRNQEREKWRDGHNDEKLPLTRFNELLDEFDASGKGSLDDGDPQTTNLYVGNLSSKVDENFLLRTFGRFGPIASVKIMWPRTEEERKRQKHCGFVAFMNRVDAQAAKDEMQGVVVYDNELKIGWGKSVTLPSQALPAPPPGHMAIRSKEGASVILSGSGTPVTTVPNQNSELVLTPNVPDIMVLPPEDKRLRHVIDTMALYVLDGGCAFEKEIMERGRGNALFSFLFELGSKEYMYYVWRLYSFAQGDTLQRWRTEPFIMITGTGRWVPPALPTSKSPDLEKESSLTCAAGRNRRIEPERTLTDSQRDEFEDMLRALTLERSQVKDAMGFALDNADAASEIVEVLTESLTLKETPIPTKVARLMLVSDILHNSSAPVKNASAFRTKFEATLPDILESFNDLYRSITGRLTAEALKERVMKVLQVWSDWFLFSDAYVNGLRSTFLRPSNSGVTPFHSISDTPNFEDKVSSENTTVGTKSNQDAALAMGKGAALKELLCLPYPELERRCRHNGLSLIGGRDMMVARLLYLGEAEKQRGIELEEDLKESLWNHDGDYDTKQAKGSSSLVEPILLVSKWACEDDESDDDRKRGSKGLGLGYLSSGSDDVVDDISNSEEVEYVARVSSLAQPEISMNEEQRQQLRRLEVALMEYRESLEEQGTKNRDEIESKVAIHRRRLESDFGMLESGGIISISKRSSSDKRERRDDSRESSRKRHRSSSLSRSPSRRASKEDGDRSEDPGTERGGARDRAYEKRGTLWDGHVRDRVRDTDGDRRRRIK